MKRARQIFAIINIPRRKEGTKTITFAELQEAISNKNGSDLDCLAASRKIPPNGGIFLGNSKRGTRSRDPKGKIAPVTRF